MFVDKPVLQHPLERKQLKWLLVVLAVILVIVMLWYIVAQNRAIDETDITPTIPPQATRNATPTQEEIQKQLEKLAREDAENPTPKPTQEEIQKQLEKLAKEDAENPAPKPTQEEIQKQLEMLSKQQ